MLPILLCLYLPLIPLETLRPRWSKPGCHAVVEAGKVIAASSEARASGVRDGMRAAGVTAIAPQTMLLERSGEKERQALDAIAMTLLQFTPEVAFASDFSLIMNVTASLRLFGGVRALCRQIAADVLALGFTARLGAAPTATGAWLLARVERTRARPLRRRVIRHATLVRQLDHLPCPLLPGAAQFAPWLAGVGARDLAALRRLPRAGLLRRTSKPLLEQLDRAYGEAVEMFAWITIPAVFSAYVETFDRIELAESLLLGATRLIVQMTGWLVAQQRAVRRFSLTLHHERGRAAIAPTLLEIALAEPAWQHPHLIRLLRERLAKTELIAPVLGLRLDAHDLVALQPPTESLFPEPGGSPADFARLLELLTARLGTDKVLMPVCLADHRPEVCNAWVPATGKPGTTAIEGEVLARPFWLLPQPLALLVRDDRPFYGSPLHLLSGPERIEAGWWNDQIAARDYFVAQAADHSCYWIYLERTRVARWFLHGLYG